MRFLATLPLLFLSACLPMSAPFHIYPVEQPGRVSAIPCRFKLHFGWQHATLSASLPDGETYAATVDTRMPPPADQEMAQLWDRVFGAGYFTAKVLGSPKYFRADLKNPAGDSLKMEVHTIPGDNQGAVEGVAVASNGRLFEVGM